MSIPGGRDSPVEDISTETSAPSEPSNEGNAVQSALHITEKLGGVPTLDTPTSFTSRPNLVCSLMTTLKEFTSTQEGGVGIKLAVPSSEAQAGDGHQRVAAMLHDLC